MPDSTLIETAAEIIAGSAFTVALTGAGMSVDSGIPDFRSSGGLWERFDPMVYAHISSFISNPALVWEMIHEMNSVVLTANPNAGHLALARLESLGHLHGVITQNIDGLHQEAGNTDVVEFHGNGRRLVCLDCGQSYRTVDYPQNSSKAPQCSKCGSILKPDFVFFGESIPQRAFLRSTEMAEKAEVMLILGTSATVTPANMLPGIAHQYNAKLIEINLKPTQLTGRLTDIFLQGSTSDVLPQLAEKVAELSGTGRLN